MIYLTRENEGRAPNWASTNDEDYATQLEKQGFVRLTRTQALCRVVIPNFILDPVVPLICGAVFFVLIGQLGPYNLLDFIAAYVITDAVASLLEPMQR